jgi:hypothetical protein
MKGSMPGKGDGTTIYPLLWRIKKSYMYSVTHYQKQTPETRRVPSALDDARWGEGRELRDFAVVAFDLYQRCLSDTALRQL